MRRAEEPPTTSRRGEGADDDQKEKTTQFPSTSSSSSQDPPGIGQGGGGSGALVVNRRRQEGNPVLKYVRNVRYEWGDIGPDFECGPAFGVVYLSFKYHKQHPEYVYSRINGSAENRYRNKVLLGYCNMEEPRHVLRELNMICFREAWTLVVVYTVEEAAEYIELFKTTQKKEITIKKKALDDGGDSSMSDERRKNRETAIGFLTAARSITKTDADRPKMSDVPADANAGCPGTGSAGAGKASGCAGCPNQGACATGQGPPPDADVPKIQDRFSRIKHKILILSGKGGVGKSTLTSNLARALASDPSKQVAILDVDICGPSQPRMMGVEDEEVHNSADGWTPVGIQPNLTLMSIAFLLGNKDDAVIWRGARKNGMIKQFLKDVDWGEVDYLLIDTPPGTSDEHISLVQFLLQAGPLDGALIVSTPQEVSLLDVRKEVSFCRKTNVKILGVVENMARFVCPNCAHTTLLFPTSTGGAEKMCQDADLELLSQLPLEPALAKALDNGEDFFETNPDSTLAKSFMDLAEKVKAKLQ